MAVIQYDFADILPVVVNTQQGALSVGTDPIQNDLGLGWGEVIIKQRLLCADVTAVAIDKVLGINKGQIVYFNAVSAGL